MKSKICISLAICFLLMAVSAYSAYALNIGYITNQPYNVNSLYKQKLQQMGHTVFVVTNSNMSTVDYSQFDALFIDKPPYELSLTSPNSIPVHTMPSMILNTAHVYGWKWTQSPQGASKMVQNTPLHVKINSLSEDHYIVQGLPNNIQVYTSGCCYYGANIPMWYLTAIPSAGGMDKIVNTIIYPYDAVIATVEPGDMLFNNVEQQERAAFFGIYVIDKWTDDAETLFENTFNWVIAGAGPDEDEDGYSPPFDCDDSNPNIYPGATEVAYNNIDEDCSGYDLADVDGDNYCLNGYAISNAAEQCSSETGAAGTDCNDNNLNINPGKTEIQFNGIDDDCNPLTLDNPNLPGAPQNLKARAQGNDVVLTWNSPSSGEPAVMYNIYISTNPEVSSFDFSAPDAVTAALTWTHLSASDNYYYIVRSESAYNDEEANTFRVGKFDLSLVPGMNLISLPLIPYSDVDFAWMMHQIGSYSPISEVWHLSSAGTYDIAIFDPISETWSQPMSFPSNFEAGKGYWFNSIVDTEFPMTGIVANSMVNVPVQEGMNLVGLVSLDTKSLGDVISQLPADVKVNEMANRLSDGRYEIATYYTGNAPDYWYSPDGFSQMQPGTGYWLKASQAFTLQYQP